MSTTEALARHGQGGLGRQRIKLSNHFRERWHERGDDRLPREAVRLAPKVELESAGDERCYDAEEVRVYVPGNSSLEEPLAFPIRDRTAVTVVPLRDSLRPVGMKRCGQCGGAHLFVADRGCPYCSTSMRSIHERR
jgi:hypothetical protein